MVSSRRSPRHRTRTTSSSSLSSHSFPKRSRPRRSSTQTSSTSTPSTLSGSPKEYLVEAVLASRHVPYGHSFRIEYLVVWKGYPLTDATWEPPSHLSNAEDKVREFHRRHPNEPSPTNKPKLSNSKKSMKKSSSLHRSTKSSSPSPTNDSARYEVESILDSRVNGRGVQYLVKWQNYPLKDATWEPSSNLRTSTNLVLKFHDQNPDKPKAKIFNTNDDANESENENHQIIAVGKLLSSDVSNPDLPIQPLEEHDIYMNLTMSDTILSGSPLLGNSNLPELELEDY